MKAKFILDRKTFCAKAAIVCMILAVIFRAVGSFGHFNDMQYLMLWLGLPAVSCLLFVIMVLLFGKKAAWPTFLPVLIGIVFFMLRLLSGEFLNSENLSIVNTIICFVFYLLIAVLYSCTAFGAIKTKFFIVVLFALALAYNIVFVDYPAIAANTARFNEIFMELGILSMLLGMLFASLGFKKQTTASAEKSKDIVPPIPGGAAAHSEPEPEDKKKDEAKEETPAAEPETVLQETAAAETVAEELPNLHEEEGKETEKSE